jgi:hypothetical protein
VRIRLVLIAPLLTLVLAACGGGGGNSSSTTSAPTTTASTAPTTTASPAADTARAQKLVFVQADFPAGWTASPPTPDTAEDKANSKQVDACIGTSSDDAHSADVKGNNFSMGPTTQVGSEAQIVKEEATYRQDIAAIKGPKVQPCLKDFLTKALTKGVGSAPTSVQVSSLPVPSFGDVTVGLRITAGITTQGQALTVYLDAVLMGRNRAEVTSTFLNVGQPFDATLQRSLLDKLGAKLTSS